MKRNYELMYTQACGQSAGIADKLDDALLLMKTLVVQAEEHTKIIDGHIELVDKHAHSIRVHSQAINNIHAALKNFVEKFGESTDMLKEVHRSIAYRWDDAEE